MADQDSYKIMFMDPHRKRAFMKITIRQSR